MTPSSFHLAIKAIAILPVCEDKNLENRTLKTAAPANKTNHGKTELAFVQVGFSLKILKPISRFWWLMDFGQLEFEMLSLAPKPCEKNHD